MAGLVKNKCFWVLLGLGVALANPAWADDHGRDGHRDEHRMERKHDNRRDEGHRHKQEKRSRHFSDHQRKVASDYYGERYHRHKKCPPGLAMKRDGCAPTHAREWAMHKPLPRHVKYYPVPQTVVVNMGPPPAGHKYVRVGTDILLVAIGTQMVVDALNDIAR